MSYMLLIVEPAGQRQTRSLAEGHDLYQRMLEYGERLRSEGLLVASNALRESAVRVNVVNGRQKVTDGPFTEAKELVGGFYLLDCDNREQALRIAAECPAVEWATVEVREVGTCYE